MLAVSKEPDGRFRVSLLNIDGSSSLSDSFNAQSLASMAANIDRALGHQTYCVQRIEWNDDLETEITIDGLIEPVAAGDSITYRRPVCTCSERLRCGQADGNAEGSD